jgi:hypothetical protein
MAAAGAGKATLPRETLARLVGASVGRPRWSAGEFDLDAVLGPPRTVSRGRGNADQRAGEGVDAWCDWLRARLQPGP